MGGISNEREVSLQTGKQVSENLDKTKYDIKTYDTRDQLEELFLDCKNKKIDLCFLALHGKGGEDGTLQGMLDLLEVPYTGSGVLASSLAIDKIMTKNILTNYPEITLAKDTKLNKSELGGELPVVNMPVVIKPSVSGSSVGISMANTPEELKNGLEEAFKHDNNVLIEEYIDGVEVSVPILNGKALPVIEICPKNKFFDYEAKYAEGFCDEIVPARIEDEMAKKVQTQALQVHNILGCSGMSRVDFIIKDNQPYFLEINTTPGMTKNSLCPKSAGAAGIIFPELLDKIIDGRRR